MIEIENMLLPYQKTWIENPYFESNQRVHNWRKYVSEDIKKIWSLLQVETRIAIIIMAERQSDIEEWD